MKNIHLFNEDNLEVMKRLPDESIDVICIDPPYLYLKNQKLERPFDELKFFSECKRLLTKNGFIVMFGRGTSFYRWNTILDDLGFTFKEEIIWDKCFISSPLNPLNRHHETVSIFCNGIGSINKSKVPYLEMRESNQESIIADLKKIKSAVNNNEKLNSILNYLETGVYSFNPNNQKKRGVMTGAYKGSDRPLAVIKSMTEGMNEKSIIKQVRDHYSSIHPTQKPVRLIERLLALVIPKDKPREETMVADFFAGSMSCMEAVHNMGMQGIATEIDKEYFDDGKNRIQKLISMDTSLFNMDSY